LSNIEDFHVALARNHAIANHHATEWTSNRNFINTG
jgi:hypothetical protein